MQQLFFDRGHKLYYFVITGDDLIVNCDKCKKIIEIGRYIFLHKSFGRKGGDSKKYCRNCLKDHEKRIYDIFILAEVTDLIPQRGVLVDDRSPMLKTSTSTFDAALSDKNLSSDTSNVKIIDRTVFANKSEKGELNFKLDMTDGAKKTDSKLLDQNNIDNDKMNDILLAKPLEPQNVQLKEDNKKMLGVDKNE